MALGYTSPVWTSPLLRQYCRRTKGVEVSKRTIQRALRRQGYRSKRPRHVLARWSPSWQQTTKEASARTEGAEADSALVRGQADVDGDASFAGRFEGEAMEGNPWDVPCTW